MPGTKKRSHCSKRTFKNRKTKKCKRKKMSRSSKKSVKGGNNSKYQVAEEWIRKNWPVKRLPIAEAFISNLAGSAIDRKSSLDDYKELSLQNLNNLKSKDKNDEKKIIKFFKTLQTKKF